MTEGIPESLEEFKTETSGERADDDISDIPSESEYDIRSFFSNECMVMPNGKLELEYLKNNKLSVLKIAGVNADILKTFKNEKVYELYFRQFDFCENLLGFDIKEFPKMTINGKYFYCLYFKGVFDKQDAIKELSGKYIRGNMMYRFWSTRESKSLSKYTYQASMILCLVELNDRNELKYYV